MNPSQHSPRVVWQKDGRRHSAEAWSYLKKTSREIYIRVFADGEPTATIVIKVPRA